LRGHPVADPAPGRRHALDGDLQRAAVEARRLVAQAQHRRGLGDHFLARQDHVRVGAPQAAGVALLLLLEAVLGLLRDDEDHAVEAEVGEALLHGLREAADHGHHHDERRRAEHDADERQPRAQLVRQDLGQRRAHRLGDVHVTRT
jgi:hypothetical protein